ncbi:MAG: copper-translocating P-type ATPase [Candidatus Taylorbacteria bacterium CG11_big_fil_rev_8_21_14_0_20_46_11]|uniref:Copper-translocating P-type ATPase n=1 Tax=Candidatus Taylorbacteria bacterium CG11_big_fil_rev_8_21_14_0_20_46_11 TaxID=1975025 RepID=A0A2H0KCD5_9BACT|nr:MAG: copper-translocating P-type ATPase [Candidatus Taylorbacteria bacterium CG11_big_fil_rev_8_21_14_0_20_46_11]
MHPEVVSDKPGLCPECGMAMLQSSNQQPTTNNQQQKKAQGHDKHKGHSTNIFKVKFWVSLVLSIPLFVYSDMAKMFFDVSAFAFEGSIYLELLLGSFVFFYGGAVFLTSAYRELKARLPGMMTLIAIAIVTAYTYSLYAVFSGGTATLFFELASLIAIMLLGHWIEMRAVGGAQGALRELSRLLPDVAERFKIYDVRFKNQDRETEIVTLTELRVGDKVLVKPGGKVPADGVVVEGDSDVNEALLTGESKSIHKKKDDEVIAGSINGDGSLIVEVRKTGDKTFLSGIKRLVADAQASKSRLQLLADRAALYLTVVALVTAGATLSTWLFLGAGVVFAVSRVVAVLVVACPHALGLAIPLVASISTTKGARVGVLVKQRLALEAARNIDVVLFDKTGTLTTGEYGVTDILLVDGTADDVVSRAASIEYFSEHLIAKAIVHEAYVRKLKPVPAEKFTRIPGKGAQAILNGMVVKVGSYQLLKDDGIPVPVSVKEKASALAKEGKTIIFVMSGRIFSGAIALADIIRPESKEAIRILKEMKVKIAMVTGDSEEVGKWVAKELELDEYFARVLPEEKAKKVKLLQEKGLRIAFVGDGVNDAPALTQADLGIAIGAGTNVAIESAGIILVKNDPRDIVKVIRLSRQTYRKMVQNLWWATGYNILAIPLAAGVLASQGVLLEPAVSAILMSVSTVVVAGNAMLFRNQAL